MTTRKTCPSCGRLFTPWRAKLFCSERCRKRSENTRLRGGQDSLPATPLPDDEKSSKISEENQGPAAVVRGDERCQWVAVNTVTCKFVAPSGSAKGWVIDVADRGWFGKVRDDRGEWGFGPTTRTRAELAVERWIDHSPIERRDGEHFWKGSLFT